MASEAPEEFQPAWDVPTESSPICPACHVPRAPGVGFCSDCGFVFPELKPNAGAQPEPPPRRLCDRYEVGTLLSEREGIARYQGQDMLIGGAVVLVRARHAAVTESVLEATPAEEVSYTEPLPTAEETQSFAPLSWPSIAWEKQRLETAQHPSLPCVRDHFTDDGWEYLVVEMPEGQVLWDAWDDPASTNELRYYWLKQLAEAMQHLHRAGCMPEAVRPEMVRVNTSGQARWIPLADLLPLPLPPNVPVRGSLYTAPELILAPDQANARANLYSFGALLYALIVGRELTETDFERDGVPKPFLSVFPDSHPWVGRLVSKTFCRSVEQRFPTHEAAREDPTGFAELIHVLDVGRRSLDRVRLEVAGWTTTGMVRSGNEDAFALLHAIAATQDDCHDSALVLLADGMGGSEAGEVAAALAVNTLRDFLLRQEPFAALVTRPPPDTAVFEHQQCESAIAAALEEANRAVYWDASTGLGKQGMGCTAEVVYVRGRDLFVGHVGDSRTYLYQDGRLRQVTRDQTLVNRMVELGSLTPHEAETHPQRSELLQAIGGRAEVEPAQYYCTVKAGDWILVCSDGLVHHLDPDDLRLAFQDEAPSAESAARRLVNCANLRGGIDNTTVVVIRAL